MLFFKGISSSDDKVEDDALVGIVIVVGVVTLVGVSIVVGGDTFVAVVIGESVAAIGAIPTESIVFELFVFEVVVFTLLFFLFVDVPELRTFLAIFFASSI